MKLRSTGLGDTELVLSISEIKREGDCLILIGKSSEPVKWRIRVAACYIDLWQMARLVMSPANLFFLIRKTLTFKSAKKVRWPYEF